MNGWVEKLDKALADGYDGLRLTGNTFWLEKEDWNNFVDYEKKVDEVLGNYQMMALCTYNLDRCNATEVIDVVINHQFALIKKKGKWEQIESSRRKEAEKTTILQSFRLQESQAKLETALASMTDAVFISDTLGNFINFNDAFATFHKFKDKDECSKIFAEYPDILDVFMVDGTPAPVDTWAVPRALRGETGTDIEYTLRRKETGETWIGNYSFAPIRDKDGAIVGSVVIVRDVTKKKQEEHRIFRHNLILKGINQIFTIVVQEKTEEELGNECLSVALEVTGSQLGFVNLLGDDGLLHDVAISDIGWKQCLMYDKTGHRRPQGNFVVHGLYGNVINNEKSFFTNDPMSHPDSIGIPCGHPQLTSFLGVPLVLDGKMMGMLGVANREGGYSSEQ